MSEILKILHYFLKEEPVSLNFIYDNHHLVYTPITRYAGPNSAWNRGSAWGVGRGEMRKKDKEEQLSLMRSMLLWLIIAHLWNIKGIRKKFLHK